MVSGFREVSPLWKGRLVGAAQTSSWCTGIQRKGNGDVYSTGLLFSLYSFRLLYHKDGVIQTHAVILLPHLTLPAGNVIMDTTNVAYHFIGDRSFTKLTKINSQSE